MRTSAFFNRNNVDITTYVYRNRNRIEILCLKPIKDPWRCGFIIISYNDYNEQAAKGDNTLTVIYYMDYFPLSNIRQLNEMGVTDTTIP